MRRCAFLTLSDPSDFFIDDEHAYAPLSALGWDVDAVPWDRADINWDMYDAVVIRSPWDYQNRPEDFVAVLERIEASDTHLYNDVEIVLWNLQKTYLRELAEWGVPIVPTVWQDRLPAGGLRELFDAVETQVDGADDIDEIVVKPVISANADGAFRLTRDPSGDRLQELEAYYGNRALMAQPFVPSVIEEGEFSLFYFEDRHCHSILKTPKRNDFRVQEEHGGQITAVEADEQLIAVGAVTMAALDRTLLYARADFVRCPQEAGYWLMEFELIEPALYLRMDPDAPTRFATALDERVARDDKR
ncbi:MAG: hypothetical protein OEV00_02485 [Acidobacteriota bacterium]|nr:hypothetical protein [Acidobacteriota bacterium]MDH3784177.1 hypothetical protein [Acidobacteriota bacterium]